MVFVPFRGQPGRTRPSCTHARAARAGARARTAAVLLFEGPLGALDEKSLDYWRGLMVTAAQSADRLMLIVSHEDLGVTPTATLDL